MKSRRYALVSVILLAVAALTLAAVVFKQQNSQAAMGLPELYPAPAFKLTDSTGAEFDSSSLRGHVWVANFMFTSCQGICPLMTAEVAALAQEFRSPKLRFVSISVDPERDTPEVLAAFANQYHADTARWHFVCGPVDTIRTLSTDGFKVGSLTNPTDHSSRLILVDSEGQIRG